MRINKIDTNNACLTFDFLFSHDKNKSPAPSEKLCIPKKETSRTSYEKSLRVRLIFFFIAWFNHPSAREKKKKRENLHDCICFSRCCHRLIDYQSSI